MRWFAIPSWHRFTQGGTIFRRFDGPCIVGQNPFPLDAREAETVHAAVRSRVPMLDADRAPAPDIATIAELIASRAVETACATRVK